MTDAVRAKTLILGMGNPILSDDGAGIMVAQEISRRISDQDIEVKETNIAGFAIIDEIAGYRHVIIVDAVKTKKGIPGTIHRFTPADFRCTAHLSTPHTISFGTAIALAEKYGYDLPKSIEIYGIEVEDNTCFGESCTPKVRNAVHRVVDEILKRVE
jgi:hydrogenase maturation protease